MSSHLTNQSLHSGLPLRCVAERPLKSMGFPSLVSGTRQGLLSVEAVMTTPKSFAQNCHMRKERAECPGEHAPFVPVIGTLFGKAALVEFVSLHPSGTWAAGCEVHPVCAQSRTVDHQLLDPNNCRAEMDVTRARIFDSRLSKTTAAVSLTAVGRKFQNRSDQA
jgi:hypothetical protein